MEMLEESQPVRPLDHRPPVLGRKAGGDEIPHPSPLVDRRDHAVLGAGQRAGALDGLFEHCGQVETLADPQDRRAQPGGAVAGGSAPGRASIRIVHGLHFQREVEVSSGTTLGHREMETNAVLHRMSHY